MNVIQQGKELALSVLEQIKQILETNTEVSVSILFFLLFVVIYMALKEFFDILTGSNKSALKKQINELDDTNGQLLAVNFSLENDYKELETHANSLADELNTLKAIKFDEVFSENLLKDIAEKQGVLEEDSHKEESDEETSETEKKVIKSGYLETI